MRLAALAGALLPFLVPVAAFKDTCPLYIWSSTPNDAIREAASEITSGVIAADSVYGTLSSLGCDFDAMVVVHVDELHQSHTENIKMPHGRKADLHIPYLVRPQREALDNAVRTWALECGSGISWVDSDPDTDMRSFSQDLPERNIVLLTGSRSASASAAAKRQERPFPSHTTSTTAHRITHASSKPSHNASTPNGPLLDRIQILNTPVITSLLVSFGILIPIALCGVSALAGIQVPPRMLEISKSAVSKEKKEQ